MVARRRLKCYVISTLIVSIYEHTYQTGKRVRWHPQLVCHRGPPICEKTFAYIFCVIKIRVCVLSKQAYTSLNCRSITRNTAFHNLHFPSRPAAPTSARFIRSNTTFHVALHSLIHTSSLNFRWSFLRSFPTGYVLGTQGRFSGVIDVCTIRYLIVKNTEKYANK